ncbi:MAG TPA: M56 family metallopeptidase, partial [Longimicrobium sp.]|nr:M56 family metallopeptidase [Longimicrobium sp.]
PSASGSPTGLVAAPSAVAPAPAPPRWLPAAMDAVTMLVIVWLLGALLLLGRLAVGTAALGWMARTGHLVRDERWTACAARIRREYRGPAARLIRTRWTEMPMTCGILRPVILLPIDCLAWPDERRDVVLRHELAHVARRDVLTIMLAQLVRAGHWYNPLSWVALHQLRGEAERCCDDQVLSTGTRASAYAAHLLDMIRTTRRVQRGAGLALPMAHRSGFETRLHAILDPAHRRGKPGRGRASVVAVTFAALVLALAIAAPAVKEDDVRRAGTDRVGAITPSGSDGIPVPAPLVRDGTAAGQPTPQPAGESVANDSTSAPTRSEAREVPFTVALAALAGAPAAASPAPAADASASPLGGRFAIRRADPDEGGGQGRNIHVAMWTPGLNTFYIPIGRLQGLTERQITTDGSSARFHLRHDAGTFTFDAEFRRGRGTGRFGFVPDPAFAAELVRRGMDRPTAEQQFSMARHDVDIAFLDELARLGYERPTTEAMLQAGLNGVDAAYVRELASVGYRLGTVNAAKRMRNHDIDAEFIRGLAALGYRELPADELVRLSNYDIDFALITEMNARAGRRLSVPELVRTYNRGA